MFFNLYSNSINAKKSFAYLFAILLSVIVFLLNSLPIQAAEFIHNHTDACYSTKAVQCTANHTMSTRSEQGTRHHCPNCLVQKSHTTYVYWDWCQDVKQYFEQGGYHVCDTCGTTSYTWGSNSTRVHTISRRTLSCGKTDTASGSLWIKSNVVGWTREGITLETGVITYDSSLELATQPYSWDDQATWSNETTRQITENGTYTIYAQSSDGTIIGENIAVSNIDRTGPTLKEVDRSTSDWTNQDVTLSFIAEDLQPEGSQGCGLTDMPYSYDGGQTYVADNCFTVSGNGIYEVQMMDSLGNVGHAQIEVNNIDKDAPVISEITQVNEGWQSQSVVMNVSAQDAESGSGLHEMPFSIDGANWQEMPELILYENGTFTMYVRDAVGNVAEQQINVSNIDLTAPMIESVEALPDKIWTDKVEIVINAKDLQPDGSIGSGLNENAYSVDGGLTWQESNVFLIESGNTYDVRVRDALLWESEEYLVERTDFPYPPPVEDSDSDSSNNSQPPVVQPEKEQEVVEQEEVITEEPIEEEVIESNSNIGSGKVVTMEEFQAFEDFSPQEQQSNYSDVEQIIEQTVKFNETADDNTQDAQVIKIPWYTTVVGKTVIVSTSALVLGSLIGIVAYLLIFSAGVYCVKDSKKTHKLGRVLIHRTKEGYSVFLSDLLLKSADVPKYRIRINAFLAKRVKNARLLVESSEKNLEVLMQESIDFEL